jgi:hypothetical protein
MGALRMLRSAMRYLTRSTFQSGLPLALTLVVTLGAASAAHAARRALVVGIDSYEHVRPLRNARADARTMSEALKRAGYEVHLQTDRNLKQLQGDLRAFRQRVQGGDEVVFFFSGHGVQFGGSNYLLPTDIRSDSEDQVRDDALALARVLEDFRELKPKLTLAIIDACRDNPFAGRGRTVGRGLAQVTAARGEIVIYAAAAGEQALDRLSERDPVPNGLFTRVFVKEMAAPGKPVYAVLKDVQEKVWTLAKSVGHEQLPAIYDNAPGNFYFHQGAAPAAAASRHLLALAPTPASAARVLVPVPAPASQPPAQAASRLTPRPPAPGEHGSGLPVIGSQSYASPQDWAVLVRAAQEPGALRLRDGLVYRSLATGDGAQPRTGDTLLVKASSKRADGTVLEPAALRMLTLERMAPCWREALPQMRVKGRAQLTCRAELALGAQGGLGLAPNATVQYEVELLSAGVRAKP